MAHDTEANYERRYLRYLANTEASACLTQVQQQDRQRDGSPCRFLQTMSEQSKLTLNPATKSLSSQVMEYYHKYSQNTNLDQYLALPMPNIPQEAVKYYYSLYELSAKVDSSNRQDYIAEEYNLKSYVPRERRRWVRPPLIGQSSNTDASSKYVQPLTDLHTPSPDLKCITPEVLHEDKNDSAEKYPEVTDRRQSSPTSSTASYKPLEWDSGADVGYFNTPFHNKHNDKRLSTIERMALARGCSAALRLDPEGTTESGKITTTTTTAPSGLKLLTPPNANSTPLVGRISGSESEIEITPIVKDHLPGIIMGDNVKSQECSSNDDVQRKTIVKSSKYEIHNFETPMPFPFKIPIAKYSTVEKRVVSKRKETVPSSPLKKSTSMNVLMLPTSKTSLKRSQSELNLYTKEKNKAILPLIYNSTSSIATVVNKPVTCDKVIQTTLDVCAQESVGIQVSGIDESKSPSIETAPGLQPTIHSILKKSHGTYKIKTSRKGESSCVVDDLSVDTKDTKESRKCRSGSDVSQNASTSITPQPDETEDVSGRANSFEYFPGHTYANVPNGRDSHVSSDTGRSNSTLPNSSSSVNEKLWGDSDSLVRDLERSVNILKSLVDANKCDKEVKKRLIQHVIKRLVTAKYTEDQIEHNLEDNIPWNPDDARNKVYRNELLQALATKQSTTESSDEWNHRKKNTSTQKLVGAAGDVIKEVVLESSASDKFDRHTDRTEIDGRKARLGLRTDDSQRNSNTPTDPDKSESSECFVPQRNHKHGKVNDIFCFKDNRKLSCRQSNSILSDGILLDTVVNNNTTFIESSNNTSNNVDWRLPTTASERQFELNKCSMSESGDSKLVNYAEMEKRQQLIWITNEISHLCNLKKLLEQPRRLEKPKSSPRKSKSTNFKSKHTMMHTCRRGQNAEITYRDVSKLREYSINEPWSSHCNLATCEAANDDVVKGIVKRNSCTQTTTSTTDAYSKTGGEILSAFRTRGSGNKRISVGVQTFTREMSSTPMTIESDMYNTKHTNSQNLCMHFRNDPKHRDQSYQKYSAQIAQHICTRCNNSSDIERETRLRKNYQEGGSIVLQQMQTNCTSDNSVALTESSYRRMLQNNGNQHKQKENKNQINASKSKCTCTHNACSSVNDSKSGSTSTEGKRTEHFKRTLFTTCTCLLCSKQTPIMEVGNVSCDFCLKNPAYVHEIMEDGKKYVCMNARECDDIPINSVNKRITVDNLCHHCNTEIKRHSEPKNTKKSCNCAKDCACQNVETITDTSYECRSNGKINDELCRFECRLKIAEHQPQTQIYSTDSSHDSDIIQQHHTGKVQNNLKCNCNDACSCNNKQTKDIIKGKQLCKSYVSKANFIDNNSVNKTERNYRHCYACGTMYQNTRKCSCCKMYPKAVAYELSFIKEPNSKNESSDVIQIIQKPSLLKQTSNTTKPEICPRDIIKRNTPNRKPHQIRTLQDYLSKNKPEFVGNAETRRQYLSEIYQLRELRKQKRIQLLAMAATSNIIGPAQISKPAAHVQKKITDEEMRERLRKRYFRLSEVRFKRRQQERQEEARRNKLMAKIFCKRLQQKVLKGQVDLSQSVSVISNL